MIRHVLVDPRVRKQQQNLSRSGKTGVVAARQVDRIIERLVDIGRLGDAVANMTKHGELRIKNCIKFDLGSGYRLITLKQGDDLCILYAGTHDDCDRWIENNRELPLALILNRCEILAVDQAFDGACDERGRIEEAAESCSDHLQDPGAGLIDRLGDRELRIVFSGLCGREIAG